MDFVSITVAPRVALGYIIHPVEDQHDRPSRTPLVGVVADRREASFGAWSGVDLCFVWSHYAAAVSAAGGLLIAFPPEPQLERRPELLLDAVDGLLLSGGRDIDASSYREPPDPRNEPGDPLRDRVELAVGRLALSRGVPVLGVCRGMQLLNLIAGGGIAQHLEDPEWIHRGEPGTFVDHDVEVEPGSRLAAALGGGAVKVRSHHHQGVAAIGAGLTVTARSPDGLVEAFESEGAGFCVAVLWHPEEDLPGGGAALYRALVEAAATNEEAVR